MKADLPRETVSPGIKSAHSPISSKGDVAGSRRQVAKSRWLRRIAGILVILVCFFFLGRTLYSNLEQIGTYHWQLEPVRLILSFVFLGMNLAVSAVAWQKILTLFGIRLPLLQSFKIMFVSAPGKYVPGKIWIYLSQIYLSQKANVPKGIALFSMLLLFGGYVLAGVVVFVFSLFFWEGISPWPVGILFLLSLSVFWVLFSPRVQNLLLTVVRSVSRRFKEDLIPEELTLSGGTTQVGQILLILLADWMIFAMAAYLLIGSFYPIEVRQLIILCGIFAVSVMAGIASFFVPAGLGVREGVQSYLLSLFIPISAAILISLIMRIWMILGETGCFLAALKIKEPKLW